jgi:hypothetical protein
MIILGGFKRSGWDRSKLRHQFLTDAVADDDSDVLNLLGGNINTIKGFTEI